MIKNTDIEKRAIEVFDLMNKVNSSFVDMCIRNEMYTCYLYRVFWGNTLIVHNYESAKFYSLLWDIDDEGEIVFSPEDATEWEEVEETWQPVERSISSDIAKRFKNLETVKETPESETINKDQHEKRTKEMSRKTETQIGKNERRTFSGEVRARDKNKIVGYAAMFNTPTELLRGKLVEEIAPTAFDAVMNDDVRALFNHSPDMVLGRTKAGTLRISVDDIGLRYEIDAPNTTLANDLLESISRGDITQSSFGFTVEEDEYRTLENGMKMRTITKCGQLFDVSPVTFPAYETTEVTARSVEAMYQEKEEDNKDKGGYLTLQWQQYRNMTKKRV